MDRNHFRLSMDSSSPARFGTLDCLVDNTGWTPGWIRQVPEPQRLVYTSCTVCTWLTAPTSTTRLTDTVDHHHPDRPATSLPAWFRWAASTTPAVTWILRVKFTMGLFESPYSDASMADHLGKKVMTDETLTLCTGSECCFAYIPCVLPGCSLSLQPGTKEEDREKTMASSPVKSFQQWFGFHFGQRTEILLEFIRLKSSKVFWNFAKKKICLKSTVISDMFSLKQSYLGYLPKWLKIWWNFIESANNKAGEAG
jgi:hypothetical protein